MVTAIDVKDDLIQRIDNGNNVERLYILSLLSDTVGLWKEAGYAYKGAELVTRIMDHFKDEEFVLGRCYTLIQRFHKAHNDYMQPNEPLTLDYSIEDQVKMDHPPEVQKMIDCKRATEGK